VSAAALIVGVLVAAGSYLLCQRGLVRITLGFMLLSHGVNVLLLTTGGINRRGIPIIGNGGGDVPADPLPQAFVLTAIVISFGVTAFLLALAFRTTELGDRDDDTEDD